MRSPCLVAGMLTACTHAPMEPVVPPSGARADGAEARLSATIVHLADTLGERNIQAHPDALRATADHIEVTLRAQGHTPRRQVVPTPFGDTTNVVVTIPGATSDLFVIGAHYDTAPGTPGADDNASGVAALLELARRLEGAQPPWTLELVAWTNEEPPWFRREQMGSVHHAADLAARQDRGDVRVVGVWSLETIGYYDDTKGSQQYLGPMGLVYPSEGNYLGFIGNRASKPLVHDSHAAFQSTGALPTEKASLPGWITGVDWSDHRSYWPHGMQAVMVTDTALFRNPHYHEPSDRPETLDVTRLAGAVDGLEGALWTMMSR